MLKVYAWKTPNGYKIPIMLEELGVPYEVTPIDIAKGAQKTPEFLAMNPNGKIPVLVDDATDKASDGAPLTIFESGAILLYLGEKYDKLLSKDTAAKYAQIEWLMFQMAGIGPTFGQANHFITYAPEKIEYAIKRYNDEAARLMGVLEMQLAKTPYLADEYSIADIATWPWIRAGEMAGYAHLENFPNVSRWYKAIESRPAVVRALAHVDAAAADGKPAICTPTFD